MMVDKRLILKLKALVQFLWRNRNLELISLQGTYRKNIRVFRTCIWENRRILRQVQIKTYKTCLNPAF